MVNARRASGHVAQAARRCRRRGVPQHQKACRTDGSSDKGSCRHGISTHPGYNQGEEPSGQTARFLPVAGVATRKGKRQRNPHASSARKARGKDFGFPLKLESGSPLQFLPGLLPCFLPRWTTAREGTAALAGGLNGGKPGASATRPWRHVAEGGRLPPAVKAPQEAPKHAATFNSPWFVSWLFCKELRVEYPVLGTCICTVSSQQPCEHPFWKQKERRKFCRCAILTTAEQPRTFCHCYHGPGLQEWADE
ncbi:uncharacterized protein LOC123027080 isoform X2 [Varanus komodoensis]|uniref:uncharacterized protein LOC123027080 isoform X2 n=1 Tax=Varanus komodoensis TaxID=61221 RepID=UPI001CF7D94D|nr:uncharacterized protein LOC123027080 isoform X2 [Varanus komodoensis]